MEKKGKFHIYLPQFLHSRKSQRDCLEFRSFRIIAYVLEQGTFPVETDLAAAMKPWLISRYFGLGIFLVIWEERKKEGEISDIYCLEYTIDYINYDEQNVR